MFERILVPLDGSPRAEQALPFAAHIARAYHSAIVLTRIVDTLGTVGVSSIQASAVANELRDILEKEAQEYLQRIRSSKTLEQLETSIEIHAGDVATALLEIIDNQSIDLVIMNNHGHTGYRQWMLGSVAQKMVRNSPAPVFIQRDNNPFPFDASTRDLHFYVALDGSELAETVIPPTLYLAAACAGPQHRKIHLFRVVKMLDSEQIAAFVKIHQINIQQVLCNEANDYLKETSERLNKDIAKQLGLCVTSSVIMGKDIAQAIMHEVEGESSIQDIPPYALLALTTHGRKGLARWAVGSVAERVFHNTKLPLLVVHPPQQGHTV